MQQTIFAPYLRTSPVHIPRRDLVLSATDSLTLRVTVVESDDPNAQQVVITGGIGGPAAQLVIWLDQAWGGYSGWNWPSWGWDYGRLAAAPGTILWSGIGTPQPGLGSFDWFLPPGTLANLPPRCGWGVQMGWDGNAKTETLLIGALNVRGQFGVLGGIGGGNGGGGLPPSGGANLLTDDYIPVLTDGMTPILVS